MDFDDFDAAMDRAQTRMIDCRDGLRLLEPPPAPKAR